MTSET